MTALCILFICHPSRYVNQFKWTVNWKFLPEEVFTGKPLAVALLALTLSTWAFFFFYKWPATATNANIAAGAKKGAKRTDLAPSYIVYTLFVSNFVGVVFARTLHYQFYSWCARIKRAFPRQLKCSHCTRFSLAFSSIRCVDNCET